MKTPRWTMALAITSLIALMASTAASQSQEDLKKLREKKLDKSFLKQAKWSTDYDAVRKQAKEQGKIIFAYFTRSYAR